MIIFIFNILALLQAKRFLLIGGALKEDNFQIIQRFLQESNGKIGIVTGASGTPKENGQYYIDLFQRYGAKDVEWIPIHMNNSQVAYDIEWVNKAPQMKGIFFGGGDQSRLLKLFFQQNRVATPLFQAILNNQDLIIAGSSAGTTIQQKTSMITGGEAYYGFIHGIIENYYDPGNFKFQNDLFYHLENLEVTVETLGGFGLFNNQIYLDTHFSERGRQGRMMALLQNRKDVKYGIGIDENTALFVQNQYSEVLGEKGVSFFQQNKLTYLQQGDKFDLDKFSVIQYRKDKKKIENFSHEVLLFSQDIFSHAEGDGDDSKNRKHQREFIQVCQKLMQNLKLETFGVSYEKNQSVICQFKKSEHTVGMMDMEGVVSFENLQVECQNEE